MIATPSSAAPRPSQPLRIRLDRAITFRALAILAVVVYHAYTVAFGAVHGNAVAAGGGIGWQIARVLHVLPAIEQVVAAFFVMSGYFAHRAYQRSQLRHSPHARRSFLKFFLWRRFWRLVPPFWAALLVSYLVSFDHPFTTDGLRKLLVNASLLRTLWPGYFFSINPAHWYVAVQWQLDLLYPLFLLVVARRSVRAAVLMACASAVVVTFVVPQFTTAAWWLYLPVRWWAEWALGVHLADRHLAGVRVFRRPGWALLGSALALFVGSRAGLPLLSWVAMRLLLACGFETMLLSRSRRSAWERRLAVVGACSYSLYLLHIPVQQVIARLTRSAGLDLGSGPVWFGFLAVSCVLAVGVANLNARLVETESTVWGNRLWRRRFLVWAWARTRRRQLFASIAALAGLHRRPA